MLISGQRDMARETQHLEELHRLIIKVGEDHPSAVFFRHVDNAQKNRYPDAVDQLSVAKINYQRPTSGIKLSLALVLDPFATQLVEIVARVDHGRRTHTARANRYDDCFPHSITPTSW